jgi:hypothetical protein
MLWQAFGWRLFSNTVCHSEPYGRRISVRLFAEFILSETKELQVLHLRLGVRMTISKGLRMTVFLVTLSGAKGLGSSPATRGDILANW